MSRLGYMYGIRGAKQRDERPGASGGEKFATAQGNKRTPGRRLAGQALGLNLKEGAGLPPAFTLPMIGTAELRTPELPQ